MRKIKNKTSFYKEKNPFVGSGFFLRYTVFSPILSIFQNSVIQIFGSFLIFTRNIDQF
jgi:hypothetical protein